MEHNRSDWSFADVKRNGPNSSAVECSSADDDEERAAAAADRVFGVLRRRRRQHLVINDAKANLAHKIQSVAESGSRQITNETHLRSEYVIWPRRPSVAAAAVTSSHRTRAAILFRLSTNRRADARERRVSGIIRRRELLFRSRSLYSILE